MNLTLFTIFRREITVPAVFLQVIKTRMSFDLTLRVDRVILFLLFVSLTSPSVI